MLNTGWTQSAAQNNEYSKQARGYKKMSALTHEMRADKGENQNDQRTNAVIITAPQQNCWKN
ncbi:hypothetical protein CBP51_19295 [Cellvibrio mixtus]|uniref:Uncharacterized protein n=1 Tax=Cellvibrio mixtus TaxID=39650 RepID=A0A266Q257_9GAMM|nr:hypothetical protein B0D95_10730 [Cellvibrio sp. PSBB023]OZY83943.1 hypothetical protein CBP51_19295 [Cellvibrio mixtus]